MGKRKNKIQNVSMKYLQHKYTPSANNRAARRAEKKGKKGG